LAARPYLEFVHPEDRDRTASEASKLGRCIYVCINVIRRVGSIEWPQFPIRRSHCQSPQRSSEYVHDHRPQLTRRRGPRSPIR
jgi:hypothetical protein